MEKKSMSRGLIFLLVLLVAVGIFLLYSRLTFTGYVTNVVNATTGVLLVSHTFDTGDFSNTVVDSGGSVVLLPTKTTGSYTSQVFDAGQSVFWMDFIPAYVVSTDVNVSNNSVVFYVRSCNDSACTGKDFAAYSGSLVGQYFQYKAVMQIFSGTESPRFSEVNVSYYPPLSLPINIESPQNITYNNESVLIKISTTPGATIWFYNGTDNEAYIGELNRTFSEGSHVLNVVVSYLDGNVNYTNSASVAFTVGFLQTYYRFANNACSAISLIHAQKTANDYDTLVLCQTHITNTTSTTSSTTSETQTQNCAPSWECDNWTECVDGIQTRICTDVSTCTIVSEVGKPSETQSCIGGTTTTPTTTVTTPTTTVTTPAKKGFFSFVGSAIVGPIFGSKIGVAFVILLVLVAGGLLAYKFFLKDKLKLKLFGKKKFLSFN